LPRGVGHGLLPSLAACLYLAGQLAGLEHLAAVPHRLCDEHGESVHAEHGLAFLAPAHREAAPDLHPDAAAHGDPHHEHCQVLSHLGQRGLTQSPRLLATLDGHPEQGTPPAGERAPHSIAPRLLAPKHSPPTT